MAVASPVAIIAGAWKSFVMAFVMAFTSERCARDKIRGEISSLYR